MRPISSPSHPDAPRSRVVLVRLSSLGDVVHAWPLAEGLRRVTPAVHVTWVVEQPLRDLVEGHPAVDQVVTVDTRRWRRQPLRTRTWREVVAARAALRALEADACLDVQGVFKSALVTRWTHAGRRIGLARPWRRERFAALAYTETLPGATTRSHVVATNLALLRAFGVEPPVALPAPDGRWMLERPEPPGVPVPDGCAVLLPAGGRGRRAHRRAMDAAVLADVARGLASEGMPVVVIWGPGEEARAREVADRGGREVRVAPPTDLRQLVWLLSRARLVVGGDTGPLHLAASLGAPTVAVFLTTDPERNAPLGRDVRVLAAAAARGGPTGSAWGRPARPVPAQEVLEAARALLDP